MLTALAAQANRLGIETALVTNMFMDAFSGSPIVALDVATALKEAGIDVTIASAIFKEPMLTKARAAGIELADLSSTESRRTLMEGYDLVWGQHWPIYDLVLCAFGIRFRYLVISCLSPHEPLESLSPSWQMADRLLFNSPGTLDHAAPPSATRTEVLPNSLLTLWREGWSRPSQHLRRIAIVSNNFVRDIEESIPLLRAQGLEVEQIGMHSAQRDVTPTLIDSFDAIITIGHTVQKALSRRRPAYVYDRFGGFGWLTQERIEDAFKLTYSGRGHGRRTGAAIAKEIAEGYEQAASEAPDLGKWADARFDLEANVACVLSSIGPASPEREIVLNDTRRHQAAAAKLVLNLHLGRVVFNPLHELYPPRKVRIDIGPSAASAAIETFWPRKVDGYHTVMEYEDVVVQGALMLRPPHRIVRLTLKTPEAVIMGRHGLASEHLRTHRPNDTRYLAAKFEIAVPFTLARGLASIEAETHDGETVTIAQVAFVSLDSV